jgi:WD40 repeat protein
MIDQLVASRLVTSDAGVVELAHESLVRAWPRLRGWLDEDVEGRRILHHLAVAADSWNNLDRPDSELYRGVRLAKALDWQARTTPTLTSAEEDFLAASKRLSQTELRAAESRARQQLRINRRLRAALVTGAFLLVGALIAGLVAVRQADRAEQAATRELARQVGARALLTEDISQSLLLAAQGVRLDDSAETRANLVAAMNKRPLLVRSASAPLGLIEFLEVSPDGRRIVSGDNNVTIHLHDARSGEVLHSYSFGPVAEGQDTFTKAKFSPDGRFVAALAANPEQKLDPRWPLVLLSADTLEPVTPQPALPPMDDLRFDSLTFSADGRYLAAGVFGASYDSTAYGLVWDLRDVGRLPAKLQMTEASQSVVLSPDGRSIYGHWPLTAYDVASGKRLWQRPDLRGGPYFETTVGPPIATLNPRGDVLAFQHPGPERSDRTTTTLVDARTGRTVRVLRSNTDPPRDMAFSGDGNLLATAQSGGEVIIWNVADGTARLRIKTTEASWAVDFSPDARRLYSGGDDGILRIHDLEGQRPYLRSIQTVPARPYLHVLTSDNGQITAYLWREGQTSWVRIADTTTGRMTTPTRLDIELQPVARTPAAWHPSGQELAVHDLATIQTVDAATGKVRSERLAGDVTTVAYVDDGKRIAVGWKDGIYSFDPDLSAARLVSGFFTDCCVATSKDGATMALFKDHDGVSRQNWRIVRVATGTEVRSGGLPLRLNSPAYSPDGRLIAGTGADGAVLTIDTQTGAVHRAAATGHTEEGISIRFSPDGTRLVSGAADGTVSLWDARTLDLLGTVTTSTANKPVAVRPTFTGGSDIVTIAAYDGKTYQWDTRIGQALAHACAMAGRNLTQVEWTQAFGNRPYEKTCPSL